MLQYVCLSSTKNKRYIQHIMLEMDEHLLKTKIHFPKCSRLVRCRTEILFNLSMFKLSIFATTNYILANNKVI